MPTVAFDLRNILQYLVPVKLLFGKVRASEAGSVASSCKAFQCHYS